MMRSIFAAALLLLALCTPTIAQTPPPIAQQTPSLPDVTEARRQAASELVEVTGLTNNMSFMLDTMRTLMTTMIQQRMPKPGDAAKIVDEVLLPDLKARLPELLEANVEIYASNYNEDEMHGLVAFYRTPLGQKLIATLPIVSQQGVAAGQVWGRRVAEEAFRKNADDLKRLGVKL